MISVKVRTSARVYVEHSRLTVHSSRNKLRVIVQKVNAKNIRFVSRFELIMEIAAIRKLHLKETIGQLFDAI